MQAGRRVTRSASVQQRTIGKQVEMANLNKRNFHEKAIKKQNANANMPEFRALTAIQINGHMEMLEQSYKDFRNEHMKIVEKGEDNDEMQKVFDDTTELYLATRAIFQTRIAELNTDKQQTQQPQKFELELKDKNPLQDVPNTWGTFDGSYEKWPSFRDCF